MTAQETTGYRTPADIFWGEYSVALTASGAELITWAKRQSQNIKLQMSSSINKRSMLELGESF
jgi:hypothetical protein